MIGKNITKENKCIFFLFCSLFFSFAKIIHFLITNHQCWESKQATRKIRNSVGQRFEKDHRWICTMAKLIVCFQRQSWFAQSENGSVTELFGKYVYSNYYCFSRISKLSCNEKRDSHLWENCSFYSKYFFLISLNIFLVF